MLALIRYIISNILYIFNLVLLVYCISSWIIRDPYNKFYRFLSAICDPVLAPVRALLQRIPFLQRVPIDFSPVILLYLLHWLARII